MTLFPGAVWRPMPGQEKRPARRKGRGVGFHIAVSERASIYDINLGTGNDAHLYVRRDGGVEQNIDLDLIAYAGAAGNGSMIWVETQGGTTAADVKSGRWEPAQAATLARIARWAHDTEGVPLQLMPDSKPASRGIGTHRLGIQHSLGVDRVPGWLVTSGERWSSAIGKECPGDARIAQLPSIIAAAIGGSQEDDMPYSTWAKVDKDALLQDMKDWVVRPMISEIVAGLLDAPIERAAVERPPTTARAVLAWSDTHIDAIVSAIKAQAGTSTGAKLPTEFDVSAVARAVADELDRRAHDGDAATGPIS